MAKMSNVIPVPVVIVLGMVALSGCAFNSAKTQKVEATPAETAEPAGPTMKIVRQQVVLDSTSLFEFDSATLTDVGKANIDRMLADATVRDAGQVSVTGHTDRIGPDDYNQGLSERRAMSVAAYLIEKGVPAERVRAVGKGESQPVVECADQAWKALVACLAPNRRVVVEFPTTVESEVME